MVLQLSRSQEGRNKVQPVPPVRCGAGCVTRARYSVSPSSLYIFFFISLSLSLPFIRYPTKIQPSGITGSPSTSFGKNANNKPGTRASTRDNCRPTSTNARAPFGTRFIFQRSRYRATVIIFRPVVVRRLWLSTCSLRSRKIQLENDADMRSPARGNRIDRNFARFDGN